eukprot:scaffold3144_cov260-Pinguiococcus_pyrenoidosus.AAC.6
MDSGRRQHHRLLCRKPERFSRVLDGTARHNASLHAHGGHLRQMRTQIGRQVGVQQVGVHIEQLCGGDLCGGGHGRAPGRRRTDRRAALVEAVVASGRRELHAEAKWTRQGYCRHTMPQAAHTRI